MNHSIVNIAQGSCLAALLFFVSGRALQRPAFPHPLEIPTAHAADAPTTSASEWVKRGAQQFQQRQWQAAETSWQKALKLYREVGDKAGEGRVIGNLAAIAVEQENYPQAIDLFQQSLAIAKARNDLIGESFALTNLGYVYSNQGNYPNAIKHLELALPITRSISDREGELQVLNQLGIIQRATSNYDRAIGLLQQSVTLAQKLSSTRGIANGLGNLGNTYVEQGSYAAAVDTYQKALPLMRQLNTVVGEAGILQRMGSLYAEIGNYLRATEYFNQSLAIAQKINDRRLQAYNLGNLGRAAYNQKNPEAALQYLKEALSIVQQIGDQATEGSLYNLIGNAYATQNNFASAKTAYQKSLEIAQKLGRLSEAGGALGSLAILAEHQKQSSEAIELYQKAIALFKKTGDRPRLGTALSNLGMTWLTSGKLETAEATLLEAIAIWESLRPGLSDADQISLFETQTATYRALQQVQILLKRYPQALETAERGRARAFVELVARRYSSQVAQRLQIAPPTIAEIRQVARQQQATLVQYSILGNSQIGIWIIQPTGEIHFRQTTLPTNQLSIDQAVEQTRFAAVIGRGGQRSNPRPNARLYGLYQLLVEPIAALLPQNPEAEVIFIPQGSLFLVPFAALQDADRNFLIERHTIRTAPSIQILNLTHTRRSQLKKTAPSTDQTRSVLVVGNPSMPAVGHPPEKLTPLPFAEQEAVEIARMYQTKAVVGQAATEPTITQQMQNAQLIHFATHGLLDDFGDVGVPGALALASTEATDGLLTTNEILNLSLNQAELVVLSACDTGRGRITGDGVVGLSRSLISAGVPSVVVSLWAVPDDSTAILMTTFYKNLQQTTSKAQALRQAMLSTMKQYPGSRNWAAFTLIGESN